MHGDGPCQAHRKLNVAADFLFLDFLFLFVELIPHVAPPFALHIVSVSVFGDYIEHATFLVDAFDYSQGAVYPATVFVVFDEDDLCTWLDFHFHGGGKAVFWKFALHLAFEYSGFTGQLLEVAVVDIINGVSACGERDGHLLALAGCGADTAVEHFQLLLADVACPDVVEYADELGVVLPIHLAQFDAH